MTTEGDIEEMTKERDIEEMTKEEVKEILKDAKTGLNKDSIAAIICFNREIDLMRSMIDSLMSGTVWAEYQGDRNLENMVLDLDLFTFHLTEIHPRDEEEIYKYQESEKDKSINKFENLKFKLPCLFSLQNFLEAGMTDNDAIELFNRYFPEAEIDIEDCNFVRQKTYQKLDKQTEKELEEKSREIVEIMKKNWRE